MTLAGLLGPGAGMDTRESLSPLEIGMHALHYVAKAKGGRGKKGGLSGYAKHLGKDLAAISRNREAARVAETLDLCQGLLDKAAHLSAIHKLPGACWPVAVTDL